jgi:hypothetical protein
MERWLNCIVPSIDSMGISKELLLGKQRNSVLDGVLNRRNIKRGIGELAKWLQNI